MEAVRTNVEGTDNVLHAAIEAGVKRVVCLSTDKAAYPINAMGISKAMMEHVIFANARVAAKRGGTVICCTRYGNVMCSRGSVIPLFIDQIKNGKKRHSHRYINIRHIEYRKINQGKIEKVNDIAQTQAVDEISNSPGSDHGKRNKKSWT